MPLRNIPTIRLPPVVVIITFGALLQPSVSAGGDLSDVRDAVRSGDDDDDHHSRRSSHCDDDDDDWGWESLAVDCVSFILTSPIWVPHALIDEGYEVPGYFHDCPYDDGCAGIMLIGPDDLPPSDIMRLDVEYAVDFDDLERIGGKLLWEHSCRLGVETSVNFFQEDLGLLGDDRLWLGDVNVVYRFAQSETILMRAGMGVNWLADQRRADAGVNFTYMINWFPVEPLVLTTELDGGTLGDAGYFHGRATVGVVYDHVEFYTGVDHFHIGEVSLDTYVAGFRLWF